MLGERGMLQAGKSRVRVPMRQFGFFFSIYVLWIWGFTQRVPEDISGSKAHVARKADNLTAICGTVV
jgi:hypothetical protein